MAQPEAVGSFMLVGPAHHRPASCCPQICLLLDSEVVFAIRILAS